MFFVLDSIPDQYKTLEICDIVISLCPFLILYCPDNFFFLCGFSFMNIHESQDCRRRGRLFHQLLTTTSIYFTDTQTLAGRLLQRAHLCTQPAAGLELGTFGFSLAALKLIPNWFVTSKMIKKLYTAFQADDCLLFLDEDSGDDTFCCTEMSIVCVNLKNDNLDNSSDQ